MGAVSCMQVVVEYTPQCCAPVGRTVVPQALFGSVGAQQVVEAVSPWRVLSDEMGTGELGQRWTGFSLRQAGQAGRGRDGEVMTGVQAELPEQPCSPFAECVVGSREDRARITGR